MQSHADTHQQVHTVCSLCRPIPPGGKGGVRNIGKKSAKQLENIFRNNTLPRLQQGNGPVFIGIGRTTGGSGTAYGGANACCIGKGADYGNLPSSCGTVTIGGTVYPGGIYDDTFTWTTP